MIVSWSGYHFHVDLEVGHLDGVVVLLVFGDILEYLLERPRDDAPLVAFRVAHHGVRFAGPGGPVAEDGPVDSLQDAVDHWLGDAVVHHLLRRLRVEDVVELKLLLLEVLLDFQNLKTKAY